MTRPSAATAVVFAYHDVGVRCLKVLLAHGVTVPLVVTHRDDPGEGRWFASVAETARDYALEVIFPAAGELAGHLTRVRELAPDFLFSFHYRHLLPAPWLGLPKRGALNVHGSLLPHYRGRAPVNWAVLRGERETGATLHYMTERPDAGPVVARQAVPILPDDTAAEVMHKVTVAAEMLLDRALPGLLAGTVDAVAQDLSAGSYFGARRPEDGRVHWTAGVRAVHDLVRAVAPPYPGAFFDLGGHRLRLLATRVVAPPAAAAAPRLYCEAGRCHAVCADGGVLRLLRFEVDDAPGSPDALAAALGPGPWPLLSAVAP